MKDQCRMAAPRVSHHMIAVLRIIYEDNGGKCDASILRRSALAVCASHGWVDVVAGRALITLKGRCALSAFRDYVFCDDDAATAAE